jgi:hypothetical protein
MSRKFVRRTHVCAVAALFAVPASYAGCRGSSANPRKRPLAPLLHLREQNRPCSWAGS